MTARWWVGVAGLGAGGSVVLATLLSLFAESSWLLDLAANFRYQYLWIGVLALGALSINRVWKAVPVLAVAVLVNLIAVAPYWFGAIADAAGEDRLEILHLNTRSANPAKENVVEFVRTSDADLVFLAEVTPRLAGLLEAAKLPFERVAGTPPSTPIGIVALARPGIATGRLTNLGVSEVPAVLIQTELEGEVVEILGFHTSSPGEQRRSADRNDQLAAAGALVSERSTPMILVGDFNATPWTPALRRLLDTGLVDAQRGRGVDGSWPAGWGPFQIPIDHVLHTTELTSTAFAFGDSVGSDHESLRVTIARAERGSG